MVYKIGLKIRLLLVLIGYILTGLSCQPTELSLNNSLFNDELTDKNNSEKDENDLSVEEFKQPEEEKYTPLDNPIPPTDKFKGPTLLKTKPIAIDSSSWVIPIHGVEYEVLKFLHTDAWGNIYMIGDSSSPQIEIGYGDLKTLLNKNDFDTHLFGFHDVFVFKFNPKGELEWAKFIGGMGQDWVEGFKTDQLGNIILVGNFESKEFFIQDGITREYQKLLNNNGGSDVYLLRLNQQGELNITTDLAFIGGSEDEYEARLSTDGSNTLYVVGRCQSEYVHLDFATYTSCLETENIFIANYDIATLKPNWIHAASSTSLKAYEGLHLDHNKNLVLALYFYNQLNYIADTWDQVTNPCIADQGSAVLLTIDRKNGHLIWSQQISANLSFDPTQFVTLDSNNNIYLNDKQIVFDDTCLIDSLSLNPKSLISIFNSNGVQLGEIKGSSGELGIQEVNKLTFDVNNRFWLLGIIKGKEPTLGIGDEFEEGRPFLIRRKNIKNNGLSMFLTSNQKVSSLDNFFVNQHGNFWVTGSFANILSLDLGDGELLSNKTNRADSFLAHYNVDGELKWKQVLTSENAFDNEFVSNSLLVDSRNKVYIQAWSNSPDFYIGKLHINYPNEDPLKTKYQIKIDTQGKIEWVNYLEVDGYTDNYLQQIDVGNNLISGYTLPIYSGSISGTLFDDYFNFKTLGKHDILLIKYGSLKKNHYKM